MSTVLRLFVLIGILVGLIAAGVAMLANGDAAVPPLAAAAPLTSTVDERIVDGWTVLDYAVAAGDAVVIRLSDSAFASCTFKLHHGPRTGTESIEPGIVVDYVIVPIDAIDQTMTERADGCAEYWWITD